MDFSTVRNLELKNSANQGVLWYYMAEFPIIVEGNKAEKKCAQIAYYRFSPCSNSAMLRGPYSSYILLKYLQL